MKPRFKYIETYYWMGKLVGYRPPPLVVQLRVRYIWP